MTNRVVHVAQSAALPCDQIRRFAHLGIGQPALCHKGFDIVLRHSCDDHPPRHPPPELRKPMLDFEKRQIAAEHYGKAALFRHGVQPLDCTPFAAAARIMPDQVLGLVNEQQPVYPDSLGNLLPRPRRLRLFGRPMSSVSINWAAVCHRASFRMLYLKCISALDFPVPGAAAIRVIAPPNSELTSCADRRMFCALSVMAMLPVTRAPGPCSASWTTSAILSSVQSERACPR